MQQAARAGPGHGQPRGRPAGARGRAPSSAGGEEEDVMNRDPNEPILDPAPDHLRDRMIDDQQFSVRTRNALRLKGGLTNMHEVARKTRNQLLRLDGFGRKALREVVSQLEHLVAAAPRERPDRLNLELNLEESG